MTCDKHVFQQIRPVLDEDEEKEFKESNEETVVCILCNELFTFIPHIKIKRRRVKRHVDV